MSGLSNLVCLEVVVFIIQVIADERKRQFYDVIYPGTKWCGPGNVAEGYEDLGSEVETDSCCRDHDNCPDYIESGQTKHNLTNNSFYTKLNCECDENFLKCLKKVDEKEKSSSQSIGQIYFNMLETKCFKEEYPVVGCANYNAPRQPEKGFKRQTVVNAREMAERIQNAMRGGSTRCAEYQYDKKSPKKHQWFDVPHYETGS